LPARPARSVRVVAPASPVADNASRRGRFKRSLKRLAGSNLELEIVPEVWLAEGYLAGADEVRVRSLVEALDSGADVVWAARGGYGCTRILRAVDELLAIRARPSLLLGFSDLTALFPLLVQKGVRCVHGPVLAQVGSLVEGGSAGFAGLLRTLSGAPPRRLSFSTREEITEGSVSGPLWGGNLSLSAALCGTPYAPDYEGAILFLEEIGEPPYSLDRLVTQLELAGVFEAVKAVLIGDLGVRGRDRRTAMRRLSEVQERFSIPVASGLPAGHFNRNACIEVGVPVELRFEQGKGAGRNRVSMTWI
jgi:muramoyltetrapeptide carboxypeptidase